MVCLLVMHKRWKFNHLNVKYTFLNGYVYDNIHIECYVYDDIYIALTNRSKVIVNN